MWVRRHHRRDAAAGVWMRAVAVLAALGLLTSGTMVYGAFDPPVRGAVPAFPLRTSERSLPSEVASPPVVVGTAHDASGEPRLRAQYEPPLPRARLESGTEGPAVVALQHRLTELHYDVGPLDGLFGPSTHHGVVAFQKVNGMERDGIVDDEVWDALEDPVVPTPQNTPTRPSIEVDLTTQVLYYVVDGRIERILDASTGGGYYFEVEGETRFAGTTLGSFEIFRQIPGWSGSSVGDMYDVNYFVYRTAIHGYPSVPPYPASHGCVRITLQAMDRLWPNLYLGMPVFVYET